MGKALEPTEGHRPVIRVLCFHRCLTSKRVRRPIEINPYLTGGYYVFSVYCRFAVSDVAGRCDRSSATCARSDSLD